MDAGAVGTLITDALDGVATSVGFAPGQVGFGQDVLVIFCAAPDDFRRYFPALPAVIEKHVDYGPDGPLCIDLIVGAEVSAVGPWRVSRADIDRVGLEELAHDATTHARAETLRLDALASASLEESLARIADFLRSAAHDATTQVDRASHPDLD